MFRKSKPKPAPVPEFKHTDIYVSDKYPSMTYRIYSRDGNLYVPRVKEVLKYYLREIEVEERESELQQVENTKQRRKLCKTKGHIWSPRTYTYTNIDGAFVRQKNCLFCGKVKVVKNEI